MAEPFRVVVAGAGVAGVEALLALHDLAGRRVQVALVAPADEFVYRPLTVAEPFGLADPRRLSLAALAAEHDARRGLRCHIWIVPQPR